MLKLIRTASLCPRCSASTYFSVHAADPLSNVYPSVVFQELLCSTVDVEQ